VALASPANQDTGAADVRPCSASDLDASAGWQGATGSMLGGVVFTNRSSDPCLLTGRPVVQIVDGQGEPLPVVQTIGRDESPGVLVIVQPQEQAFASIHWWPQWCQPSPVPPLTLHLRLPGGSELVAPVRNGGTPRCDAPERMTTNSVINVGTFQWPPNAR